MKIWRRRYSYRVVVVISGNLVNALWVADAPNMAESGISTQSSVLRLSALAKPREMVAAFCLLFLSDKNKIPLVRRTEQSAIVPNLPPTPWKCPCARMKRMATITPARITQRMLGKTSSELIPAIERICNEQWLHPLTRSLVWRNTHLQRKRCRRWFGCAFQGEWNHIGPPSENKCCQRSVSRNNEQEELSLLLRLKEGFRVFLLP